jgi:ATP-binding protein involved in chromosome partitioning
VGRRSLKESLMSQSAIDPARIEAVLASFPDPETGRDVRTMDQVRDVQIADNEVRVALGLTTYSAPIWEEARADLVQRLSAVCPAGVHVEVTIATHNRPVEPIGGIGLTAKSVIAVGSGKGGVGKSTVAASLAAGLAQAGCRVGLMDADVYGPSIPHLLGADGQPTAVERRLQPVEAAGMRVMSMGFLVPPGEAVVWRGPMLHGAITQFLRDTDWGELDYLVIDMPPGTGDIALTLSQLLPLTGAIVVCTPQDVALLDAVKAIAMFRKVNIPLLGLVENMSYFQCPDTGKRWDIFGTGGARRKAAELSVPFLGEVPIQIPIRERGDAGQTASNTLDVDSAPFFAAIVKQVVRQIAASRAAEPPMPTLSIL